MNFEAKGDTAFQAQSSEINVYSFEKEEMTFKKYLLNTLISIT